MSYESFEELTYWQLAKEFQREVSKIIGSFPNAERFNLKDQLLRSSRSISDNIAEGHGRFHYQENIQFCRIARGSLEEAFNQLITARDEGYISSKQLSNFRIKRERLLKVGNGYIRFLAQQKKTNNK